MQSRRAPMSSDPDKLFNRYTILLVPFGIALNILLAQAVLALKLPVFLDSLGTIYVAALGGLLPGIMVGFFSNAINSIGDPITLYYSVLSILFALVAVLLTRRAVFRSLQKTLLSALLFAFIGGVLGSLLTWALSGLQMGSGISSPYVERLHTLYGLSPFFAQLTADFTLDLADKLVTAVLAFLMVRFTPDKLLSRFPYGALYLRGPGAGAEAPPKQ